MAKNCINPQCEKELPSNAHFCSYCGTQQVENENLSEEEKLRKELTEMHQTTQLLKKALADAQQNSDSSAISLQTIEELQNQLDTLKNTEKSTIIKYEAAPHTQENNDWFKENFPEERFYKQSEKQSSGGVWKGLGIGCLVAALIVIVLIVIATASM